MTRVRRNRNNNNKSSLNQEDPKRKPAASPTPTDGQPPKPPHQDKTAGLELIRARLAPEFNATQQPRTLAPPLPLTVVTASHLPSPGERATMAAAPLPCLQLANNDNATTPQHVPFPPLPLRDILAEHQGGIQGAIALSQIVDAAGIEATTSSCPYQLSKLPCGLPIQVFSTQHCTAWRVHSCRRELMHLQHTATAFTPGLLAIDLTCPVTTYLLSAHAAVEPIHVLNGCQRWYSLICADTDLRSKSVETGCLRYHAILAESASDGLIVTAAWSPCPLNLRNASREMIALFMACVWCTTQDAQHQHQLADEEDDVPAGGEMRELAEWLAGVFFSNNDGYAVKQCGWVMEAAVAAVWEVMAREGKCITWL